MVVRAAIEGLGVALGRDALLLFGNRGKAAFENDAAAFHIPHTRKRGELDELADLDILFVDRLPDLIFGRDGDDLSGNVVDELDLGKLEFAGVEPAATGWPAYHPATLLKVFGYLSQIQVLAFLAGEPPRQL